MCRPPPVREGDVGETNKLKKYRSSAWFSKPDKDGFIHRSWVGRGLPEGIFEGRPIIGICNTWSELTPCNGHFRELADHVKRGVWEAGGLPFEFPVMSLGETSVRPTAMLFRNLAAMDVEESIRANPIDGVVLLCGCDKTTPSLIMGAASCDLPALVVSGGPMLNGKFRGADIGSGTDVWRFSEEVRGGMMSVKEFMQAESCMSRSSGTCNVMGTASTMASMAESLGLTLPENAAIPAVDSRRYAQAHLAGRRIVELVKDDVPISKILTRAAFENAIRVNGAIGGSTNAVLHLLAIAGRVGVPVTLQDWDDLGRAIPTIVDLMPSGRFLMEDFYYAGGLRALLNELRDLLSLTCRTVNGKTLGENLEGARIYNDEVIRSRKNPLKASGGLVVVKGSLAPNGAVIKAAAASPKLLKHVGKAVVFDDYNDMAARIDRDDLEVDADSVLVLRNAGPLGGPGMPEWGMLPVPKKLLKQGVRDMVRISDARMSGTSYGCCVLHVAPESFVGGPLAFVRNGDLIELDVERRALNLKISPEEMRKRKSAWKPPTHKYERSYGAIFSGHVKQADEGCDFDFLEGTAPTPEPEIH